MGKTKAPIAGGVVSSGGSTAVISPEGRKGTIPTDRLREYLDAGYKLESAGEYEGRLKEEKYGGVGEQARTFAESALDTFTLGGSSAIARAVDPELAEEMGERREVHPVTAGAGTVLGAVAPGGAGALAGKVGAAAAGTIRGAGALSRIARPLVQGVAEGAVFGAGQGVSDVALSENPINAETILRAVGSNALYGAAAGGVVGAGGALLREAAVAGRDGMRKLASKALPEQKIGDDLLETLSRGPSKTSADVKTAARAEAKGVQGQIDEELAALKRTREGVETEVKAWKEEVVEKTSAFRADIEKTDSLSRQWRARARSMPEFADEASSVRQAYSRLDDAMEETKRFFPAEVRKEAVIGKRGGATAKTRNVFEMKLDDAAIHRIVREQPEALAALQRQREAAVDLLRTVNPQTTIRSVDDAFRQVELPGVLTKGADAEARLAAMGEGLASPKLEALQRQMDDLEKVYRNDPVRLAKETRKYVDAAEAGGLRATPDDLAAAAKANGLEGVPQAGSEVEAVLKAGVYKKAAKAQLAIRQGGGAAAEGGGIVGTLVGVGVGMGVDYVLDGPLGFALGGMAGGLAGKLLRGGLAGMKGKLLQKAMKASGVIADGVDALLKSSAPAAARRGATALGSVLASASFGDPTRKATTPQELLKARTAELAEYQANPVAMERRLHERLEGIRAVDLKLGDQLWSLGKRKLEFLAEKMPKNPGIGSVTNPDRWRPSEGEIAKFERYVRASEDPLVALDDMRAGRLTPETVETLQAVYPAMYAEIQRTILEKLPELRQELSYPRRLNLSIFGVDVDSSLRPEFIASMQAGHATAPAQQQVTPRPKVPTARRPEGTPAQEMAG